MTRRRAGGPAPLPLVPSRCSELVSRPWPGAARSAATGWTSGTPVYRTMVSTGFGVAGPQLSGPATPRPPSAEAAQGDAGDEADGSEGGDRARTAVAHERERDPGHRHDPHRHAHVLEDLEDEQREDADAHQRAEEVTGEQRRSPRAPDDDREEGEQCRRAEDPNPLADGGEDEIGVLLGHDPAGGLGAVAEPAPGHTAVPDRVLRLVGVVRRVAGVLTLAHEARQALDLIPLQDAHVDDRHDEAHREQGEHDQVLEARAADA